MKKSVKDQTVKAFQTGGYNPPAVPQPMQPYAEPTQVNPRTGTYTLPGTGIAGYQIPTGSPTGYVPYGGATPYFQPVQFTDAQYQTALQTTNLPTFGQTVGGTSGYDELRTYINDAGQTLQIPFKNGRPIYPIPEGYRPIGDQPAPTEEQTTVIPTVGQTQVTDEGGDRDKSFEGTGYKGLSTTSLSGGISEAAAKAKADLGITGNQGHSIGSIAALAGTVLGIPGSLGLAGNQNMGFIGATAPTQGMTGTLSESQLEAIAKGTYTDPTNFGALSPADIPGLSPQQAQAVLAAQYNYGVQLNGLIGYTTGSISPTYGTPVRNGMTVDSAFGLNKTAKYASFADMVDTVTKGIKSGWRGGYVSQDTYNNMTTAQQNNYDKFDSTFEDRDDFSDAVSRSKQGIETMTSKGGLEAFAQEQAGDKSSDSGPSAADVGGPPGVPGEPGMGGAAPGGAPEGTGMGTQGGGEFGPGDSGAPLCLTENMKVKLNGVIDYVTNVNVGDIVGDSVVVEVMHKHMRNGYYIVNGELEITNDHPVLAKAGGIGTEKWTRTDNLVVGDTINGVKVTSLEYVSKLTPTVYIGTEDDRYDVYTEGEVYTVHGQYKNITKQAA